MRLHRALAYFLREASSNLLRSWRISLLAISTIAVTLFIGGGFLLVGHNLTNLLDSWKAGAKVAVYLDPSLSPEQTEALRLRIVDRPWVQEVVVVDAAAARQRFAASFPSLSELLDSWEGEPLPPSLEIGFDPLAAEDDAFGAWVASLREDEGVLAVDDDRDWLEQLDTALRLVVGVGTVLASCLLAAAVFTIASVIRLTAYLYREEIAVMRLVGATEFFIRGPFYVEGLLQGLAGGAIALGGLAAAYHFLLPRSLGSLLASALAPGFLPAWSQVLVVALGGLAGVAGAIVSLRREPV